MPIEPLSPNNHGHLQLKQGTYFFLEDKPVIQLSLKEAVRAALDLPMAFIRSESNTLAVASVLSLQSDVSAHVGPQGGWLGTYMPLLIKAHPFSITFSQDRAIFLVDTDSDWLTSSQGEGHDLFDLNNQPSRALQQYLDLLKNNFVHPKTTGKILQILDDLQVLTPWRDLSDQLLKVDQDVLNQLDAESFANLRSNQVLALVYAHLFSTNRLDRLKNFMNKKQSLAKQVRSAQAQENFGVGINLDDDIIGFS